MDLQLSKREFRRLLDMAYIGNWVLNSMRGQQRFADYDQVEQLLFAKAVEEGMTVLGQEYEGKTFPSRAFVEGGIHNAIAEYEGFMFFDLLAEDLTHRDMGDVEITPENYNEFLEIMDRYLEEFQEYGTDNLEILPPST